MPNQILQVDENMLETKLDRLVDNVRFVAHFG